MKRNIITGIGFLTALWLTACSSTGGAPEPRPNGSGSQALVAKGDCSFEACSSLPSSLSTEPVVECAGSGSESCSWSAGGDDDSVSYSPCADSDCPVRPDIHCPGETVRSQSCGNENGAGCAWTTHCTPPRETTPCAAKDGCASQPLNEIGVICSDGSTGGFVCVTDDTRCYWERNCD